jgi:phosphatidylserine/phosphatidylglycerophosphate/cardiolipin synthase-like enzyme
MFHAPRLPRACEADRAGGVAVMFGGPDLPPRALRDLLEQRIDDVHPGGSIDWATYYFRDQGLAAALVRAHRRGVAVRVCLEGRPRHPGANDAVIRLLGSAGQGIGDGLTIVSHVLPLHLHLKLYCFSGPRPTALLGSFNPSGDAADDAAVMSDIGDQDRGHNLLVEFAHADLVSALVAHIARLQRPRRWLEPDACIRTADAELFFTPFVRRNPLLERLSSLPRGSVLRVAASHVRDFDVARCIARLVANGVAVHLLTGDTERRSPGRITDYLAASGVRVLRFRNADGLPMHCKFMLADAPGGRWAAVGSYNLTRSSRWLNRELLAFSANPVLWRTLDLRWTQIADSCA